jgi:putative peptidoglycan lipid II flippase
MTRAAARRAWPALARTKREFLAALLAVWLLTVGLAGGLLVWAPHLLLKKTYAAPDVILVTAITAAIMLVRNFRTPPAVMLQAVGEFKALAGIGTKSCILSVLCTLALLLALGPIASLGGILVGEVAILIGVHRLAQDWLAHHG